MSYVAPRSTDRTVATSLPPNWWWGFALYTAISVVHIGALFIGSEVISGPTKLALMPALTVAVLWAGRGSTWSTTYTLLFLAIALSWIGDGAGAFFPGAPTLPIMLVFFGLAHLCYIWLFTKRLPIRTVPRWSLVYVVWWIALVAVLVPVILSQIGGGPMAIAVSLYGIVLGATAATAARCHPVIAWGGAFFLASDTILAFRLFTPEAMPDWTSGMVMLTYCLGQGLIAAGVVISDRDRTIAQDET
ncbi:lysoplasmalogenase [Microbacterium lacus]|uniref:lysoplasmalogenase family protein n=1 Tax=Microbacterium lacus TaxID=415217 RepID=UPI00384F59C2